MRLRRLLCQNAHFSHYRCHKTTSKTKIITSRQRSITGSSQFQLHRWRSAEWRCRQPRWSRYSACSLPTLTRRMHRRPCPSTIYRVWWPRSLGRTCTSIRLVAHWFLRPPCIICFINSISFEKSCCCIIPPPFSRNVPASLSLTIYVNSCPAYRPYRPVR